MGSGEEEIGDGGFAFGASETESPFHGTELSGAVASSCDAEEEVGEVVVDCMIVGWW